MTWRRLARRTVAVMCILVAMMFCARGDGTGGWGDWTDDVVGYAIGWPLIAYDSMGIAGRLGLPERSAWYSLTLPFSALSYVLLWDGVVRMFARRPESN